MPLDMMHKGGSLVRDAVTLDNQGAYPQALALYKRGLAYLLIGLKTESNANVKRVVQEKCRGYMNRAEELDKLVNKSKHGAANGNGKGESGAGGGGGGGKKVASPKGGGGGGGGGKKESGGSGKKAVHEEEGDADAQKMQDALSEAIVMEKPNVSWDDVAGLETAKALLNEAIVLPRRFPQLFTGKRKPWKAILLYGPPGTGKSYLAKAVATEAGASTFLSVSSADLVSKWQGESERLVRNLFELARKRAPSIIFIDEIDSMAQTRSDSENDAQRRIKTEFLVQMQGVGHSNDDLLVLGATNVPWDLDPAVRRRFDKRIEIPLPDLMARKRIFQVHIGKTPHNLTDRDFLQLARRSEGFSGSDVAVVVREALYEPIRACQRAEYFCKVPNDQKDAVSNVMVGKKKKKGEASEPDAPPPPPPDFLWQPCSRATPGAVRMTLDQVPANQLKVLDVTADDFFTALGKSKPTVGPDDLRRIDEWTNLFGEQG